MKFALDGFKVLSLQLSEKNAFNVEMIKNGEKC